MRILVIFTKKKFFFVSIKGFKMIDLLQKDKNLNARVLNRPADYR